MTELTGRTVAEMLGRQMWDFAFEQDVPALMGLFDRRLRGWSDAVALVRFRHRDGHEVWTRMAAGPIWGESGCFAGALDLFTDLSARKCAERAPRAADRRFQLMADNAPVLIWQTDATGVVLVNRYALEFFAQPLKKLVGTGWQDSLHPDDRGYLDAYKTAFEQKKRFEYQCRFARGDGEYRWLHNVGLPYNGADGTFAGFIGCSFDVTDNRRAADALIEADAHKDQFLAQLAHELRAPLAAIVTGVRILQSEACAHPKLDEVKQMIHRQTKQMARLADDLLDVFRIKTGKLELKCEAADVNVAVRGAMETCEPLINQKHHTIDLRLSPEPVYADIDVGRIEQVLCNLLTNAAKYMGNGGRIELNVTARQGVAVIAVRDEGIGIDREELSRIFDRFAQVDMHPTDGGLGIGLTLVKEMVEMHGGTVTVHSEGIGRGSEFTVRLPIARLSRTDNPRATSVSIARPVLESVPCAADHLHGAESKERHA